MDTARYTIEFPKPQRLQSWFTVDDVVMGGVSRSQVTWVPASDQQPAIKEEAIQGDVSTGFLRFEGVVSLEQNGGFCSVRTDALTAGISQAHALVLRVRGDGQSYKCTLRFERSPSGASLRHDFVAPDLTARDARWATVRLPLSNFKMWRRGTELSHRKPWHDLGPLRSAGFLISNKQAGPFRLDVAQMVFGP